MTTPRDLHPAPRDLGFAARRPVLTAAVSFGLGSLTVLVLARVLDPDTWKGRPLP